MSSVVDGEDGEEGGSSSSATWSAASFADLDLSDDERRKVRLVRLPNHLKPVLKQKVMMFVMLVSVRVAVFLDDCSIEIVDMLSVECVCILYNLFNEYTVSGKHGIVLYD